MEFEDNEFLYIECIKEIMIVLGELSEFIWSIWDRANNETINIVSTMTQSASILSAMSELLDLFYLSSHADENVYFNLNHYKSMCNLFAIEVCAQSEQWALRNYSLFKAMAQRAKVLQDECVRELEIYFN